MSETIQNNLDKFFFHWKNLTSLGVPSSSLGAVFDNESIYKRFPKRFNFYMQVLESITNPNPKVLETIVKKENQTRFQREEIQDKLKTITQYFSNSGLSGKEIAEKIKNKLAGNLLTRDITVKDDIKDILSSELAKVSEVLNKDVVMTSTGQRLVEYTIDEFINKLSMAKANDPSQVKTVWKDGYIQTYNKVISNIPVIRSRLKEYQGNIDLKTDIEGFSSLIDEITKITSDDTMKIDTMIEQVMKKLKRGNIKIIGIQEFNGETSWPFTNTAVAAGKNIKDLIDKYNLYTTEAKKQKKIKEEETKKNENYTNMKEKLQEAKTEAERVKDSSILNITDVQNATAGVTKAIVESIEIRISAIDKNMVTESILQDVNKAIEEGKKAADNSTDKSEIDNAFNVVSRLNIPVIGSSSSTPLTLDTEFNNYINMIKMCITYQQESFSNTPATTNAVSKAAAAAAAVLSVFLNVINKTAISISAAEEQEKEYIRLQTKMTDSDIPELLKAPAPPESLLGILTETQTKLKELSAQKETAFKTSTEFIGKIYKLNVQQTGGSARVNLEDLVAAAFPSSTQTGGGPEINSLKAKLFPSVEQTTRDSESAAKLFTEKLGSDKDRDDLIDKYENDVYFSPNNEKVEWSDRAIFFALTYIIRAVSLFLTEWAIYSGFINNFVNAFALYFGMYTSIFLLVVFLTNARRNDMIFRMIFFYMNSQSEDGKGVIRIIVHLICILMLLPIPYVVKEYREFDQPSVLSFSDKATILSGVEKFSMYTWILTSIVALNV